jgi:hypothetical protein
MNLVNPLGLTIEGHGALLVAGVVSLGRLIQEPVYSTDATDDVTQDLLDFLARWPLAGAQQRQRWQEVRSERV